MKMLTTAFTILVLAGSGAAFAACAGSAKMNQTTAQQNESSLLPPASTQS
jgi:hypothetical protein